VTVNDISTKKAGESRDLHLVEPHEEATLRSVAARHFRTAKDRTKEALKARDAAPAGQAKIFVSYSRDDPLASSVCKDLEGKGYALWVDKTGIPGAADYNEVISQAIRGAEVVLVLLSPHVTRNPDWVWRELKFAQEQKKRIVPVWLRAVTMPQGFDLALAGIEAIDLEAGWNEGMDKLVDTLGDPQRLAPQNARARLARLKDRVIRVWKQHDFERVLKLLAVGSAMTVAAAMSVSRARQQQQTEAEREQELAKITAYINRTDELLARALKEVKFTEGMSIAEYRDDFRPRFNKVLGQLQEVSPPTSELVEHHRELTERLSYLLEQFDALASGSDEPGSSSHLRRAARLNAAWTDAITSTREWFDEAMRQYGLLAA
jgi:TIR domain-containing protein